jgi:ethanolamine utilization protein EutA
VAGRHDAAHRDENEAADGAPVDIEGLEHLTLRSVGIDIGSATTHLVFARLGLRREGGALSARWVVSEREVLHRSPITLTPYRDDGTIDAAAVLRVVDQGYADAGLRTDEIDTGAVLITGEALKRQNARPIVEHFAREGGRFVCASAGPNHEAILAAHGSGAVALSASRPLGTILHLDIGGGTTKIARITGGRIEHVAAVSAGARLICVDADGRVTRIDGPGATYLRALGLARARVGDVIPVELRRRCAALMWDVIAQTIRGDPPDGIAAELLVTPPLPLASLGAITAVVVSGGVAEYVYGREEREYGDLGPALGDAVRNGIASLLGDGILVPGAERIRATVIGASEYTVQASGQTSYLTRRDVLPVRGLTVVRARIDLDDETPGHAIVQALSFFDRERIGADVALALAVGGSVSHRALLRVARAIRDLVADADKPDRGPFVLLLDMDVARSLGGLLTQELDLRVPLVVADGIDVGELDFVDIGSPIGIHGVLPVTVHSLIFPHG